MEKKDPKMKTEIVKEPLKRFLLFSGTDYYGELRKVIQEIIESAN